MQFDARQRGFSLIELLVVVAIIAILAAVTGPAYRMAIAHANCAGCSFHMHTLAGGFVSFATDNDGKLPNRMVGSGVDKWPTMLLPYMPSPAVYVDPGDTVANKLPLSDIVSNDGNKSSFFFNGFNDLGTYSSGSSNVIVTYNPTSSLALLGEKVNGSDQYYMDFVEGNQDDILNKKAYFGGANYAFADGSVQYIRESAYKDTMWLVDKNYPIPPVPPGH